MAYQQEEGYFNSHVDNLRLFYRSWIPEKPNPKKSILLHHGFGEHSGRYENVVRAFEGTGISIFALDARGHGKSGGKQGYLATFDHFVEDLYTFRSMLEEKGSVKKPVLVGHSMGGLIALKYCLTQDYQNTVRGVVSNGAAITVKKTFMMEVKLAFGQVLKLFAPDKPIPAGLELKYLSHDPKVVEAYQKDPLVHGLISIRMAEAMIAAGEYVLTHAPDLTLPVMVTHGGADGISDPDGTRKFYERVSSADKTLHIYDGLYHEVYNELHNEQPLKDLREWVEKHLK